MLETDKGVSNTVYSVQAHETSGIGKPVLLLPSFAHPSPCLSSFLFSDGSLPLLLHSPGFLMRLGSVLWGCFPGCDWDPRRICHVLGWQELGPDGRRRLVSLHLRCIWHTAREMRMRGGEEGDGRVSSRRNTERESTGGEGTGKRQRKRIGLYPLTKRNCVGDRHCVLHSTVGRRRLHCFLLLARAEVYCVQECWRMMVS